jgi:predicted peroxiredoxin
MPAGNGMGRPRKYKRTYYFERKGANSNKRKATIKQRLRRKLIKKQLEKKLELHTPETLEEKVNKALPMGVRWYLDLLEEYGLGV